MCVRSYHVDIDLMYFLHCNGPKPNAISPMNLWVSPKEHHQSNRILWRERIGGSRRRRGRLRALLVYANRAVARIRSYYNKVMLSSYTYQWVLLGQILYHPKGDLVDDIDD